jgi:hypothetical protein
MDFLIYLQESYLKNSIFLNIFHLLLLFFLILKVKLFLNFDFLRDFIIHFIINLIFFTITEYLILIIIINQFFIYFHYFDFDLIIN